MKNFLFIASLALMVSCTSNPDTTTEEVSAPEERAIGFNTMLPELKFHIGTEEAVQIVKDLDVKWAAEDYDGMKAFFVDTAKCYFEDGRVANSADEFVAMLKEENEDSDSDWTFDYAFSVDLDPKNGGEHVQAGFTGTSMEDGKEVKKAYHESYYIIGGKIVTWNQFTRKILKD